MHDDVIMEAAALYERLLRVYLKTGPKPGNLNPWAIFMHMRADISAILVKNAENVDEVFGSIKEMIRACPHAGELAERIDPDLAKRDALIRLDWAEALRNARKGTDLSHDIGFGFSKNDIRELAVLHRKNRFRGKIEDLLTDCNFHKEAGDFMEGRYEEYI